MKSKVFAVLMTMAVVTMVGILGATNVSAEGRPAVCDVDTFTITPAPGPFPRQSVGDECGIGVTGWVWEYVITNPDPKAMSSITKMHVYIPSLPPYTVDVLDHPAILRGMGPEAGNKIFGNGIYNGVVATVTALSGVSDGTHFQFCTDLNSTGTVSMALETSRSINGCMAAESDAQGPIGGIVGPGYDPSGYVAVETDRTLNLGDFGAICVKKNPVSGCIKNFYDCDSGAPLTAQGMPNWMTGEVLDMGNLENPLCREAVIARKGSPLAYWGYANGMYYCLGVYDTELDPVWYSPCSDHPQY